MHEQKIRNIVSFNVSLIADRYLIRERKETNLKALISENVWLTINSRSYLRIMHHWKSNISSPLKNSIVSRPFFDGLFHLTFKSII